MKKYIIPLIITIAALSLGLFTYNTYKTQYATFKNFSYQQDYNEILYNKLNGLTTFYLDALNKEYLVWKRAKTKEISAEYIESISGIKASNLNNKYCKLMEENHDEDNVVACIETYYDEIGLYQLLRVEYEEIFKIYQYGNNNTVRQKAISILYLIDDLKHLNMNSSISSEKYYEKYREYKNEIENQLEDMYKKV